MDVYGTVGDIFDNRPSEIADYLIRLEKVASPFTVRIEDAVVAGDREAQFELTRALTGALADKASSVQLSRDEWCNTVEDTKAAVDASAVHVIQIKTPSLGALHNSVEAALYCKRNGVMVFLGGACNGTDQSTRVTVHIALATQADLIYNKPGMGVDEGYIIVFREMQRTLTVLQSRKEVS